MMARAAWAVLTLASFVAIAADAHPAFAREANVTTGHVAVFDPSWASECVEEIYSSVEVNCRLSFAESDFCRLREQPMRGPQFVEWRLGRKICRRGCLGSSTIRQYLLEREIGKNESRDVRQSIGWRLATVEGDDLTFRYFPSAESCQSSFDGEDIGAELSFGGFGQVLQLALARLPQFIGRFHQPVGGLIEFASIEDKKPGKNSEQPISWFVKNILIPGLFLASFFVVMIGSDRSLRFARWAIPILGFGWLAVIIWFGML